MKERPVRIAVTGSAAEGSVWQGVTSRLRGGRITAFADSAQAVLERYGTEVDAVVIRNPLADDQAARCVAEAHKHVLVDSPVAENLVQAEAVIEACEAAGVCFCVGQTLRYQPEVQAIASRLSCGKLGEPGLLRVHRWRGGSRRTLAELLFADVELAVSLFGAKPAEIYAVGRQVGDSALEPIEEPASANRSSGRGERSARSLDRLFAYVQVHFGFPAGGMAVMDFSTTLPGGDGYDSLSLIGSRGAAYADDHHNTHLLYRGDRPAALISGRGNHGLVQQMQEFVAAIQGKTQPRVGIGACRAVHQVIEAVAHSLSSGRGYREREGAYDPA